MNRETWYVYSAQTGEVIAVVRSEYQAMGYVVRSVGLCYARSLWDIPSPR